MSEDSNIVWYGMVSSRRLNFTALAYLVLHYFPGEETTIYIYGAWMISHHILNLLTGQKKFKWP